MPLPEWAPLPGPQTVAFHSEADVLFFGGAAGGGKTDLLLGLALTAHRRAIIFRREYPQLKAIEDRAREVIGTRGAYNSTDKVWRLSGDNQVELGAVQHLGDEQKYQGRPHDLKGFDEICHFAESQFRFLCGWLRTPVSGQRMRVVCTGNPPISAEGEWVIRYWAPWLDPKYPHPAAPGELRWFTTLDGKDVEVPSAEPFEHDGEIIVPKSRTFIPARVEDNPYLLESGYKSTLQALPEPLRSKMLLGDFSAGQEEDPWQVIPTAWVRLAQERWRVRSKPEMPMTALGVDVARGGGDRTVITPRYGNWFDEPRVYPGSSTPDGPSVAALVMKERQGRAAINVDVIGIGASVYDCLRAATDNVVAMNASEGSTATDRSGELSFTNKRAEWWWKMREALDPHTGEDLALPSTPQLLSDLCAPRWKLTVRGIQVEAKDDIIRRIGRSPDLGDSAVYALAVKAEPGWLAYMREKVKEAREGAA